VAADEPVAAVDGAVAVDADANRHY
jgi:hypothetical protein